MQTILWKSGQSLAQAFGVPRGITCLVGGGGKTTLMLALAHELAGNGARAIVTTTTHIFPPEGMAVLSGESPVDVRTALEARRVVCLGVPSAEGKLAAPSMSAREMANLADYVFIEADGAKRLPLKAPASHEPVVPAETAFVIAVAGLDGIGRTIREAAFRPELYAELLGADENRIIAPQDAARVLACGRGQRKGIGNARFCVLLNKADDEARIKAAMAAARALEAAGVVERTVIASLKGAENS